MATIADLAEAYGIPYLPKSGVMPKNTNRGDGLCIMTWAMLGVATVLVAGRVMSKILVLNKFRLDDVFLLLTWACSIAYAAGLQLAYHHGFGRHSVYLTIPAAIGILKWAYVCQMFCVLTPLFGRISVALYTIALFGKAKRILKPWLWSLIVLQTVANLGIVITLLCVCGFDMMEVANPLKTCYRPSPWSRFAKFVGAFNAFTDGALVLTPVFMIMGLHTTRRAKWLASALLGFSSIACGAAVWRTIELDEIFAADWDFTHSAITYFYASSFEQCTILVSAAIPTLSPAIKYIRSKSSSTFASAGGTNISRNGGELTTSPRHSSSGSVELQKELQKMLGVSMPGLGNTVTISAGKDKQRLFSKSSRDSVMPMTNIKTVRSTDIKVEAVPAYSIKEGEEDVEKLFSMPKVQSRDGNHRGA